MRKFAYLSLMLFFMWPGSSWAQVRDLFAEFEEEASVESSQSGDVASSSSLEVPASSALEMSSAVQVISSSVDEIRSSSSIESSSSLAEVSSSQMANGSDSLSSESAKLDSSSVSHVPAALSSASADTLDKPDFSKMPDSTSQSSDSTLNAVADSALSSSFAELSSSSVESSSSMESSSSVQVAAPVVELSSSSMSRRDLLGPVKVSRVHGIDEMKGKYKNPKKALFMSLVVPGSGQMYVGGSTFTYVRGGLYLAIEAALWGGFAYFSVYKYDEQVDKYKKFAKEHFSIGRYEAEMRNIYAQLSDETEETRFEERYMANRESFCEAIYGTASASGCYTAGKLFYNDKAHYNRFSVSNPSSLKDELKTVGDFYDASSVYQQIADKSFVLGWDDVEDAAVVVNLDLEDEIPEDGVVPLGKSSNMDEYRSMRNKANDYADMQAWFFGGLILNHIVSAIDAALTANSHNKALYAEDLSWYDNLHFDSYVSVFDGFDVGVRANWGF